MSYYVRDVDECVKALEVAVEAMDPPLDVFGGILRLIAEFVPYGTVSMQLCWGSDVLLGLVVVRFVRRQPSVFHPFRRGFRRRRPRRWLCCFPQEWSEYWDAAGD